jgi:hypothetical protein
MLSARRTASTLTATIVAATLAACGTTTEAGPGPVVDTGPRGSEISDEVEAALGPKVTVRLDITGAVTFRGTTTGVAPSGGPNPLKTCAEYAKGTAEKQYLVPGELDGPVGDEEVAMDVRIADYAGPGTYPKDKLGGSGPGPYIAAGDAIYATWADGATSEATTDGKGGGSWTFTKLANRLEGSPSSDAISGTVSWTCQKR